MPRAVRFSLFAFRLLLVALLLVGAPALAQEPGEEATGPTNLFGLQEAPVGVRVHPLADGLVREADWAAIRVELENRAGPTTVSLSLEELDISSGDSNHYERVVDLPQGARKDVYLYYRPGFGSSDRELEVVLGRKPFSAPFKVHRASDADVLVGVIGDDPQGLPVVRDTWNREVPGGHLRQEATERAVYTGLVPVAGMPDRPQAYAPLDWVVWPRADATEASAEDLEALLAWVADGGHLLVTVSDTWRNVAGTPLGEALPVALTGVQDVDEVQSLVQALGGFDGAGPVPVARGQLRTGREAQALAVDAEGNPLWAVGAWGLGTVHVVMADTAVAPLASVPRESLWRSLLWLPPADAPWGWSETRAATLGLQPWVLQALRFQAASPQCVEAGTAYVSGLYDHDSQLLEWLNDIPGVAPLPISWLLGFSALYLLVIGPVDYFLLKAIRRQPWTWVTFPLTIAVFSAAALVGTSVIKGNQAVVNRMEVVDVLPDAGVWRGSSFLGVFATRKSDIQLTSGFDDSTVGAMAQEAGFVRSRSIRSTEGPAVMSWRAETWTLGYVQTSWITPSLGQVRLTETPTGWSLTSELAVDLDECALVVGDRAFEVGPLPAGAQRDIWRSGGQSLSDWASSQDAPLMLLTEHRESEHGHLDLAGRASPTLVGLADKPIEPLRIEGLNPDSRTTTVMRIHLVVDETIEAGGTP